MAETKSTKGIKDVSKFRALIEKGLSNIMLKPRQEEYVKYVLGSQITFCSGPAGTSKTFTGCYAALRLFLNKEIDRIILTKPIVESGEKLGYLPGGVEEKIAPYMDSYVSNFYKLIGEEATNYLLANNIIELRPLPYMRGAAQPLTSDILTPHGYKKMGDIQPGDQVIGNNGKPTTVLNIYPQGIKNAFRVTFSDGTYTDCCDEHLWDTKTLNEKIFSTKKTSEIKDTLYDKYNRKFHKIPITEPVEFEKQEVTIDPYLIGLMLGDGSIHDKSTLSFSTADYELIEPIEKNIDDTISVHKSSKYDYRLSSNLESRNNILKEQFRELNLLGIKSNNKFIPDVYKFNSIEVRLAVLQGLMDTDGSIFYHKSGKCKIQFYTASEQLSKDVIFLVQSLGGVAHKSIRKSKGTKGIINEREFNRNNNSIIVDIKLPNNINPFRLSRKVDRYTTTSYVNRQIISIEPIESCEMQCIEVENDNGLYLTNDFIVTHNTYDNCLMILDEAQNCDFAQLMLYITRMGRKTKVLIAGDVSQYDINYRAVSLPDFIKLIEGVNGVRNFKFTSDDIVRSKILIDIVNRYEEWKVKNETAYNTKRV